MNDFHIAKGDSAEDGELVDFGPFDASSGKQPKIPSQFTRVVQYPGAGIEAVFDCVFTGDKIELANLTIKGIKNFVSTKVLTQLAVPAVIREMALQTVPDHKYWSNPKITEAIRREPEVFLAQIYWFEHVTWGSPRARIMELMAWSRTNANFHIKKISKDLRLPGTHSLRNI